MKVPVSILIPIRNEAFNLKRCLAAVAWADEIFVVDSNSTDGSQQIVAAFAKAHSGPKDEGTKGQRDEGTIEEKANAETLKAETGNEAKDERPRDKKTEGQKLEVGSQWAMGSGPDVKLVQFQFNGTWPKKKNWALENLPFKHEWVFILDADEVMPPEAEQEFREIVSRNSDYGRPTKGQKDQEAEGGSQVAEVSSLLVSGQLSGAAAPVGYWINRRFMFMGKWLQHAYYPNWNLRLFKHKLGRYEKLTDVDTASGDNEVHEHVVVQGQTAKLKCEMDHYAFPSVDVFIEKHNRYSNWEARVALDKFLKGSSQTLQSKEVGTLRQLKQLSQRLPFRPLQRFLYVYLWQRGFLDGIEGWHFARLHAVYEYLCVVKTAELKKKQRSEVGGRRSEVRK